MQAPPPPPSNMPYIGAPISLISNMNLRYEGTLYTIDPKAATVALKDGRFKLQRLTIRYCHPIRCFGTENRESATRYPPSAAVFEFIVFSGKDIKDLHVMERPQPQQVAQFHDPAILSTHAPTAAAPSPPAQATSSSPQPTPQPLPSSGTNLSSSAPSTSAPSTVSPAAPSSTSPAPISPPVAAKPTAQVASSVQTVEPPKIVEKVVKVPDASNTQSEQLEDGKEEQEEQKNEASGSQQRSQKQEHQDDRHHQRNQRGWNRGRGADQHSPYRGRGGRGQSHPPHSLSPSSQSQTTPRYTISVLSSRQLDSSDPAISRQQQAKAKNEEILKSEFNIQESNARFNKDDFLKELHPTQTGTTTSSSPTKEEKDSNADTSNEEAMHSSPSYSLPVADDVSGAAEAKPNIAAKYDKKKSFFDELSTDKDSGGRDVHTGRMSDKETFGEEAVSGGRGRGGWRGGGGGRGGGGYYSNRGGGGGNYSGHTNYSGGSNYGGNSSYNSGRGRGGGYRGRGNRGGGRGWSDGLY